MEITSNWLTMNDQVEIHVKKWVSKDVHPQAILQLSHGMAEHIERYDEFAQYLVQKGVFVFGNDHRGHGKTAEKAGLYGFFAEEDGFEFVVNDLYHVNQWIQKEFPDIPIYLMGHSMGSFLARRYIQKYSASIKGVIISGTAGSPGVAGKLGKQIAKREIRKKGAKTPSPLLDRLSFGSFNKGMANSRTKFDWLTSDHHEVEKYINDPLCGFLCSAGYFYDLFTGLEKIHNNELIQHIPNQLPMFIFSGDKDPVGGMGKGVQKVIKQYEQNGLQNIESKFFHNGRHEMLNETNKEDVYQEVYQWLKKRLKND
ncbi:alpha/beta hydrolase [Bacillus sp. FSL K6-3431]|uniref:alpha/beta hydrolase n=1 Tax=Bacillus sp. FSL K6-3431 TaxID=2921500 RepID=UPI0030F8B0F3